MANETTVREGSAVTTTSVTAAATFFGVAGVIFFEGALIGLVALMGPLPAFILAASACTPICALIAYAFDAGEDGRGVSPLVARARVWIARNRTRAQARAGRLADLSEGVAFAVLSLTVGPFLTTVVVKLRGPSRRTAYVLGALSSTLFSAVWVAIYAGGIAVVTKAIGI
jgi:hypothetical protein